MTSSCVSSTKQVDSIRVVPVPTLRASCATPDGTCSAASGLTNEGIGARLNVSPRTVSAHLHRIFPRLGITSRAALRDAPAEVAPPR